MSIENGIMLVSQKELEDANLNLSRVLEQWESYGEDGG